MQGDENKSLLLIKSIKAVEQKLNMHLFICFYLNKTDLIKLLQTVSLFLHFGCQQRSESSSLIDPIFIGYFI